MDPVGLQVYLDKARAIRKEHGVRHIILNTEDPEIISQFEHEWGDPGSVHYLRINRSIKNDVGSALGSMLGERGSCREAMIGIVQMYLMMSCDTFVGSFESNWSRLIYSLILARLGEDPVAWSLKRGQEPSLVRSGVKS